MAFTEIPVTGETVYDGLIVRVRRDQARLVDGSLVEREVVEHPGGVAIFAIDEQERVVLVRQFRYPMGREMLELPAGKLERGEDPTACALRELEEETGIHPAEFRPMGVSYSSPGIFSEKIHLYFARGLTEGTSHPDEGEFLDVVRLPLAELLERAERNEIADGKTLIGLFKGAMLLRGEGRL